MPRQPEEPNELRLDVTDSQGTFLFATVMSGCDDRGQATKSKSGGLSVATPLNTHTHTHSTITSTTSPPPGVFSSFSLSLWIWTHERTHTAFYSGVAAGRRVGIQQWAIALLSSSPLTQGRRTHTRTRTNTQQVSECGRANITAKNTPRPTGICCSGTLQLGHL